MFESRSSCPCCTGLGVRTLFFSAEAISLGWATCPIFSALSPTSRMLVNSSSMLTLESESTGNGNYSTSLNSTIRGAATEIMPSMVRFGFLPSLIFLMREFTNTFLPNTGLCLFGGRFPSLSKLRGIRLCWKMVEYIRHHGDEFHKAVVNCLDNNRNRVKPKS